MGEFVEAEFAEEFADGGDAGVFSDLEDGAAHFVHGGQFVFELLGVRDHCAKLEHCERPFVLTYAGLPNEGRSAAGKPDQDAYPDHKRCT